MNPLGLVNEKSTIRASVERALCDKIYLDGDEHFDNVRNILWDFMDELNRAIYENNEKISLFIKKNKDASS